jgi:hypothetical protein
MIEKFDGGCSAMAVELNRIHAWVQIHDVPELYRKQHLISGAAGNIGEVIAVDMNGSGGDFVRVRLWLDVRKKLTCFVSFKPEGEAVVVMRVKFEKIPRFCAVCGMLGHEQEECGSGVHTPEEVRFGDWLLADTPWNRTKLRGVDAGRGEGRGNPSQKPDAPGGRTTGRGGRGYAARGRDAGRGHGGGRGENLVETRKRSSADAKLTEVSPTKSVSEGAGASTAAPLALMWKEPGVIITEKEHGVQRSLHFEEGKAVKDYVPQSGIPPPPPSAREQKRPKKHATLKKNGSVTAAADSKAEDRPSK